MTEILIQSGIYIYFFQIIEITYFSVSDMNCIYLCNSQSCISTYVYEEHIFLFLCLLSFVIFKPVLKEPVYIERDQLPIKTTFLSPMCGLYMQVSLYYIYLFILDANEDLRTGQALMIHIFHYKYVGQVEVFKYGREAFILISVSFKNLFIYFRFDRDCV